MAKRKKRSAHTRTCRYGKVKSGARKGRCRKVRTVSVSAKSRSRITRAYGAYKKSTSARGGASKVWHCFSTHCGRECAPTAAGAATKKRKWIKAWGSAKSVGPVYVTKSHRRDGSDPSWCD